MVDANGPVATLPSPFQITFLAKSRSMAYMIACRIFLFAVGPEKILYLTRRREAFEVGAIDDWTGDIQPYLGLMTGLQSEMRGFFGGNPSRPDRALAAWPVRPAGQVNAVVHDGREGQVDRSLLPDLDLVEVADRGSLFDAAWALDRARRGEERLD